MTRPNPGELSQSHPLSPSPPPPRTSPIPVSLVTRSLPTPGEVVKALKRRWVSATFLGGLVAAVAAIAMWSLLPGGKHQVRALVRLPANRPGIHHRSPNEFETFRQDQMLSLRAPDLINHTLNEPSVAGLVTVKASDDPLRMLEEGIGVEVASPSTLSVTLSGERPEDLKTIIDVLVTKYVADSTTVERKVRDETVRKLEALVGKLRDEIEIKERAIRRVVEANAAMGGEGVQAKHARMQQELVKLDTDVLSTRRNIQELETELAAEEKKLETGRFDPDPQELMSAVNADPRLTELLRQKTGKEAVLGRDKEKANPDGPPPPSIVALQAQIEALGKRIDATHKVIEPGVGARMRKAAEQTLRNKIAEVKDRLDAVRKLLANRVAARDGYQKGLAQVVQGDFTATNLLKELEPQKEALNTIEKQLIQMRVDKDTDASVAVREPAYVSLNPNRRRKALSAGLAGLGGFLLVLMTVGFLEWRTRRIDAVDQVVTELGMRVLGTVPRFPHEAGDANWRFALNESITSVRTLLLHAARARSMQVVMITSATQGEGKTSLASQLGTSMATAGMRALIVDCDLRNPSIHKLFDLGVQPGVSEVLCQEADVADAIQPTAVPNLWVIPAGQCSNRVIGALAQGHPLETLFNRLRGQFDFIIVDSCPVLPVADALLIGPHVDGVVFSIMQDVSQLPKVMVASGRLDQLNVPLLGAVMNGVRGASSYYGYGYNYGKRLPA